MTLNLPSAKKLRNLGSKLRRKIKKKDEKLNIFPNSDNIKRWSLIDVKNLALQLNLIDFGCIDAKKAWICLCPIRLCRFIVYYTTGRLGITFDQDYISRRFEIITDTIDFKTLKSYLSCTNNFVDHLVKFKSRKRSGGTNNSSNYNYNLMIKTPEDKIKKKSNDTTVSSSSPSSSSSCIDLTYEKQFTKVLDKYKATDKEKRECALFKSKLCMLEKEFVSDWHNKKSVAESFVFHAAYNYIFEYGYQSQPTSVNDDPRDVREGRGASRQEDLIGDVCNSNQIDNKMDDNLEACSNSKGKLSVRDLIKRWERGIEDVGELGGAKEQEGQADMGKHKDAKINNNQNEYDDDDDDDDGDNNWEEDAILANLQQLTTPKKYCV